jgi:hypothetical protein
VRGSLVVQATVWMKQLGAEAIRFATEHLASTTITIGGLAVDATIQDAEYRDGEFVVDLAVR